MECLDTIVSLTLMDELEDAVYVSDLESYELVYMNKAAKQLFGIHGKEYIGQLCHKVLQGLSMPCPFCNNSNLCLEQYYSWKHYNEKTEKHNILYCKLVELNGKNYRMEISRDITEEENQHNNLRRQLSIEATLVNCIHTLSENTDISLAVHNLLSIICHFYQAERAYIFEIDYETQIVSNTYEWCRKGVEAQIDKLQKLPLHSIDRWMELFKKNGRFHIRSVGENVDTNSMEYQILTMQGIENLMAVPLMESSLITGFIGVDNPTRGIEHIGLLQSVSFFIQNDITKRQLLYRFEEQSFRDGLTGIGNRNKYVMAVEKLEKQELKSLGIVFIDINGLKHANDHYGHVYGDSMIRNVADGMNRIFQGNVYRIGGDEFVAIQAGLSREEFEKRIFRMKQYKEEECICDFSMGIDFREGNVNVSEQISHSDHMMYAEKQLHYSAPLRPEEVCTEGFLEEIKQEIKAGVFKVYLQPQMNMDNGYLYGAEALVRRLDERGQVILPERFISMYEAEDVIQYLDFFVFEEVCQILSSWIKTGYRSIPISVNFSRITLMGKEVVTRLARIRDAYQIPPELLIIEVTENISKINAHVLRELMKEFGEHKFSFALDEFGFQYSSLSMLYKFDFTVLKLDRNLIRSMETNEKARILVEHTIAMSKSLKQTLCVAAGVETEGQLNLLRKYSCDIVQGFLFCPPLPADEFFAFKEENDYDRRFDQGTKAR